RLIFALFLVFAVSSASLVLARLAGGDFVTQSFGIEAHRETIEQARARLGLDKSIGAQYRDWLGRVVRLDLGRSLLYDRPVSDLIPERAANTAILAFTALLFATLIGLPLGVVAGSHRGGPRGIVPSAIRGASLVLLSMPPLLTSLFLIFVAARTGWRPIAAVYGIVVGTLLSGSFVVEVITAWPGLGRLMLDALRARDVFLVAGCAGAGSVFLALGSLLSDAALAVVDPRAGEP